MSQVKTQETKQIKDAEQEWVRQQIDTFYYDAYPVSTILDVTCQLEHSLTDVTNTKHRMFEFLDSQLRGGLRYFDPYKRQMENMVVNFYTMKPMSDLPRLWISRDCHLDVVKAQYVKTIVDRCNTTFKEWIKQNKHSFHSVSSASIAFLIMRPIDFKEVVITVSTKPCNVCMIK